VLHHAAYWNGLASVGVCWSCVTFHAMRSAVVRSRKRLEIQQKQCAIDKKIQLRQRNG
jgi:hypothetical protein